MGDIPPGWVALVSAILVAFGGGGYFAQRGKNKMDLIDQYQEDRKNDRERITALENRERIRDDYILDLRQHIVNENPPPPPPFPPALLGDHGHG